MNGLLKTAILMAAMTALFMAIGAAVGGKGGLLIAFGIAVAMNFFTYWNADKIVLRYYRARPADETTAPGLNALVAQMANNAGLPMPKVYVIDQDQPNAFATGRNPDNAALAITTGLLRTLPMSEIAGVMAHELAHVKNRDTLTMTITATFAGAISMLANMAMFVGASGPDGRRNPIAGLLVMILAPLAAAIIQMAISRSREYEADRIGAEICGRPLWLADALEKIQARASITVNQAAEQNPATAHLFIMNPLHIHAIGGLFASHPKTEERVRRLRAMTI